MFVTMLRRPMIWGLLRRSIGATTLLGAVIFAPFVAPDQALGDDATVEPTTLNVDASSRFTVELKNGDDAKGSSGGYGLSSLSTATFPSVTIGASSSPYPATVSVSGTTGNIIKVRPIVRLSHTFIDDVKLLLVSPTGQAVEIFQGHSDNGFSSNDAVSDTFIFDNDAIFEGSTSIGGIYRPKVGGSTSGYPSPAPAGPHSRDLRSFNGFSANGEWKLFAQDSFPAQDNGVIESVRLEIETATCNVTIPVSSGAATPYPYPINITDESGNLQNLRVYINNLNHSHPDDLHFLLVSPSGQKVHLMGNAGSFFEIENCDLVFQDFSPALPDATQITSGTYSCTVYGAVPVFPAPAPAGPYATSLVSGFAGSTLNGTWNLYVFDDVSGASGCFESAGLEFITDTSSVPVPTGGSFLDSTTITPPGSATGWSNLGLAEASFVPSDGAFRFPIATHPTKIRTSGLIRNKEGWVPSFDQFNYFGVFFIRAGGQSNVSDFNQIPNLRARLQQRFALNSMLEVFHHTGDNAAQTLLEQELRPTNNIAIAPSYYFVPFNPMTVPRAKLALEGVQAAFEAYSSLPQDQGYLEALQILCVATRKNTEPPDISPLLSYTTTASNAGALRVFNPDAELQNYCLNFGATPGDPATIAAGAGGGYDDGSFGVRMSTVDQPATPPLRVITRNFNPENGGTAYTSRLRAEANIIYSARFHVTANRFTPLQSQLRFRARSIKFSWSQKLEVGGAYAAGAINNALAHQLLPGRCTLNLDQNQIGEYGGWYTLKMYSPLNEFLRREFPDGTLVSTRMPNISAQPGPGVAAASRRDIFFGADVLDTLSTATGFENEGALMTIDRIDVRKYIRRF
jgi:subtilisin-like proprotein convertase family protein